MHAPINFTVPGSPAVKGSTFSFLDPRTKKIRTKTDSKNGRHWAASVSWAARQANVAIIPKGIGVIVSVIYEFKRPTGRDRSRPDPSVRPDADKLARALLDALTGIAYEDDGQVVFLSIRKTYGPDDLTRVLVARA